jgi:hypothetical protein
MPRLFGKGKRGLKERALATVQNERKTSQLTVTKAAQHTVAHAASGPEEPSLILVP